MRSLINYALFKEQLTRFWAIGALVSLWYILFVISPLWSAMSKQDYSYAVEGIIRILSMRDPIIEIACVVAPFAAVLAMFSYLFQSKSTTAMHAYPFSKKQLFCTNAAAGLTLIAVPLFITCVLLLSPVVWRLPEMTSARYYGYMPSIPIELFPGGIAEGAVINTLPVVAGFFFRALLSSVFYYSLFLVAVMVAGNAVVTVLICGILPFIPCAFLLLCHVTGYFFLFGYEAYRFSDIITRVLMFTNPVSLGSVYNYYSMPVPVSAEAANPFLYCTVYILTAAALFAVSYWCCHIRKQERAGDSVVFVPLRNVFIFLLSTTGMILLGGFFLGAFKSVMLMYVGIVLGFVITYFIAQMIAEKTFDVLYKARDIVKYGGIMVCLFILCFIVSRLDPFGYQTYSPQLDEVYGVYLHQPYTMSNYNGREGSAEYTRSFFVTDEEIVSNALEAHKRIISERQSLRSAFWRLTEGNSVIDGISEQSFIFLHKDGKYTARTYALPHDFMRSSGITELLSEEAVILSQYNMFKNPGGIAAITLDYYFYTDSDGDFNEIVYSKPVRIEDPDDIVSVIEELEKDIVISERERAAREYIDDTYRDRVSGYAEIAVENGTRSANHFNLSSSENVDKWLESKGLTPEARETR